jgi:glycosyltransferase involved in cell wall biosynthesis
MKLLILTQYYPPEIGAPQNRLHELAVRLKANGINVEVLTAMPNYPKMEIFETYRTGQIKEEQIDGIRVFRSGIYVSQSKSILPRLLNYFSFVWTSYWRGRKLGKYDFLMVESPPLFLGYSAIALSRKLNAKLIFNVSDLWPESAEKLGIVTNKMLLGLAYRLERKCYERSDLITGQTMGIVKDISSRFPHKKVYWLPNGVDVQFYDPSNYEKHGFRSKNGFSDQDVLFFYGGILGHAQGLQTVLHAAKLVEINPNVQIILQGAGPEKEDLVKMKEELNLMNVHFLPPVPKQEMPSILKEVDVALVPLRKLELFLGAIPSKIFEALAMEKALLLGVGGEAKAHFIDKANAGCYYEPENSEDLSKKMLDLAANPEQIRQKGSNGRRYVTEHFNRNKIAADFIETLQNS